MPQEEKHNRESRETLRERCAAMREATLGGDGGAISALQERLSYLPKAERLHILDDILALQNRIRRYLVKEKSTRGKTTEEPTPFAEVLATEPEQLTPAGAKAFDRLADVVASELSPILWRIHERVGAAAPRVQRITAIQEIATPEGLLALLSNGKHHGKESLSFFGAHERLRKARATKEGRVASSLVKAPEAIRERTLLVEDPLRNRAYWTRQRALRREMYGKTARLGELVAQKSFDAADDIERIADTYGVRVSLVQRQARAQSDRSAKEHLVEQARDLRGRRDSYRHLVEWLRGMSSVIRLVPDKDFLEAGRDLSLLDGEYEEARKLLNAFEFLKHDDPRMYARLLGIAPNVETQESKPSDWFGNAAHIAFINSLNANVRSDREGFQTLQGRLKKLTMLDERQAELYPVNQQMWQTLQSAAFGVREPQSVLSALGLTGMALYLESYRISKLLQERGREEKEDALARMRTENPPAFITDVQKHFKPPLDAREQEALEQVFADRGLEHLVYSEGEGMTAIMGFEAAYLNLQQRFEVNQAGRERILQALWETTPSDVLLEGTEFMEYLGSQSHAIELFDKRMTELENKIASVDRKENVDSATLYAVLQGGTVTQLGNYYRQILQIKERILSILDTHTDISKDQWLAWYGGVQFIETAITNRDILQWDTTPVNAEENTNRKQKTIQRIAGMMLPRDILTGSRSNFFVLCRAALEKKLADGELGMYINQLLRQGHKLQSNYIDRQYLDSIAAFSSDPHRLIVLFKLLPTAEFVDKFMFYEPFSDYNNLQYIRNKRPPDDFVRDYYKKGLEFEEELSRWVTSEPIQELNRELERRRNRGDAILKQAQD